MPDSDPELHGLDALYKQFRAALRQAGAEKQLPLWSMRTALMKTIVLFLSFIAFAHAQQAPPPARKPFSGFGGSALDKKPGGSSSGSLLPPRSAPGPAAPVAAPSTRTVASSGSGIGLSEDWEGKVTQGAGGQTRKIDDLKFLLARYGAPAADTAAHPEAIVYEGPTMDGGAGSSCRIGYLMPLRDAEKVLFRNRGVPSSSKAVAPGFPEGLFLHRYDIKAGIYNRLIVMTDYAKPEPQVVSLVLKAENMHWIPESPPWEKVERDWHTFDYVNTKNRGQPGQIIDTRVLDVRKTGHYIVAKSSGANRHFLPLILPPGIVEKPGRGALNETTTWFVPEPLIKLILYCLSKQ